jgi:transposase InsO family protein
VAFFSRTLHGPDLKHPSIEKEAKAVIESVRYWKHFLTYKHFTLKTDQKPVAYMFDTKKKSKIKNDKMSRWRMELSCYSYTIEYRPGPENISADTLSRSRSMMNADQLIQLHKSLCHPGITRLYNFIKTRNLPYSLDDIKKVTNSCHVCSECKPRFYKPDKSHLIKATQPFERLNIDFKGPLPSNNQNRYFLIAVDEYSRYPFVFPCSDMTASTVIKCLTQLFVLFGVPGYIHSDRGTSFMSEELRTFLTSRSIATSRTTCYNPQGNGQAEKYNGTVWRAVTMALLDRELPSKCWQEVLPDVLHSIRSLLCTTTNSTPHERFLGFSRRSSGISIPTWLSAPGTVLLKRHVRHNKTDPLVDEVELIQANPQYAHIKHANGREATVSIKHLAPRGDVQLINNQDNISAETLNDIIKENHPMPTPAEHPEPSNTVEPHEPSINKNDDNQDFRPQTSVVNNEQQKQDPVRRSVTERKAPDRLNL